MGRFYTKNGKVRPITPKQGIRYPDLQPTKDPRFEPKTYKPNYLFIKMKSDLLKKEDFNKAKTIIKSTAPIIASLDPTMATVYGLYKFGNYGFDFVYKIHEDYKTTGSYEKSLRNVAENELQQKILTKIKTLSVKNGSEYLGKGLWMNYKGQFPNEKIPEKFDKYAENALIHTFEEIGTKVF